MAWAAIVMASGAAAAYVAYTMPAPPPASGPIGPTSYMRLAGRRTSGSAGGTLRWAEPDSISPLLACAVLKAEDRGFAYHGGVEAGATLAALKRQMMSRSGGGGSTITQQLARNLYLGPERTLSRKTREILIAGQLEHALSKRRILELYLNVAQWGESTWGATEASWRYFHRAPSTLNSFEGSFLAAMLAAPTSAPVGSNADRVHNVQRRVLHQMQSSDIISPQTEEAAIEASGHWYRDVRRGVSWPAALARSAQRFRLVAARSHEVHAVPGVPSCGFEREVMLETSAK